MNARRRHDEPDGPRPVREPLAEVSAELGLGAPDAFALVSANWTDLVGPDLATGARPRALRDGVLTVEVDLAPWATRIRYLESQVVARAAGLERPVAITSLRVVVASPSGSAKRPRP